MSGGRIVTAELAEGQWGLRELYINTVSLPGLFKLTGYTALESDGHRQQRRAAAWHGWVFRLRFNGVFLTQHLIISRPCLQGLVVSTGNAEGRWCTDLHADDARQGKLLRTLMDVRMVRQRDDGCVLMRGLEWDEGYLQRWRQTWLCAPTYQVGISALGEMDSWLKARYPGQA
jgi:hypothetical protein